MPCLNPLAAVPILTEDPGTAAAVLNYFGQDPAGSIVGDGFPGRDLTVRGWGVSRNDDRSALTAGCGGGLPIWPGRATMAVAEEMGGQDDRSGDPWRQGGDAAGGWRA
jgi:hypothetical protein